MWRIGGIMLPGKYRIPATNFVPVAIGPINSHIGKERKHYNIENVSHTVSYINDTLTL
jgi:hypothetical protein